MLFFKSPEEKIEKLTSKDVILQADIIELSELIHSVQTVPLGLGLTKYSYTPAEKSRNGGHNKIDPSAVARSLFGASFKTSISTVNKVDDVFSHIEGIGQKTSKLENSVKFSLREEETWLGVFTRGFKAAINKLPKNLQGRILNAVIEILETPLTPKGDTIKQLVGDSGGKWRYRVGDYRLVYIPIQEQRQVVFVDFDSRGEVYK
jgi:mRNA interferase RelE/StbE